VAYTHFGARLARLGRFDSCTLYQIFAPVVQRTRTVGLHPTDRREHIRKCRASFWGRELLHSLD
jgi:hypothetical protein